MKILILGNSNIFQRKIYYALKKFKSLEIEIASKRKINTNLKINQHYHSYGEAIKKTNAEIVYISLINSKHYSWAIKSLNENKHVIVDKPLTLNFYQTKKLINLASRKKLLLAEAVVFHKHARFEKTFLKIDLNKSTKIFCKFHIPRLEKNNFRNYKKYGGGCFQDMSPYASYLINIFLNNKKYLLSCKKKINKIGIVENFKLSAKSKNIFLEASFSFNSSYKNEIVIYNKSKIYFLNYAFSPPINRSLKLEIFDEIEKKRYKINYIKQNVFYTYFNQLFKIIKKNKYNFFYKEIENIAKIKKKIS
jgi:predicted dehydrogenase